MNMTRRVHVRNMYMRMHVQVKGMSQVPGQMEIEQARHDGEQGEHESNDETDQEKVRPMEDE